MSFPDRVAALLGRYSLDGSQLVLEITETATMQNPTMTMDILTRLRVKRIGLALDDFGTGYSSLTQLYQMPFNEMKIDKSLVINVPHSREANTMVGSLIELGHNPLGLKICAEGVEKQGGARHARDPALRPLPRLLHQPRGAGPRHTEPREPLEPREPGRVVDGARSSLRDIEVNENRLLVVDDDPEVGAFFGQVGEDLGVRDKGHARSGSVRRDRDGVLADRHAARPADAGPDGIELLRGYSTPGRNPKVLIASGLDSRVLTTVQELGTPWASTSRRVLQADRARRARGVAVRLKSQKKVVTAAGLRQAINDGHLLSGSTVLPGAPAWTQRAFPDTKAS